MAGIRVALWHVDQDVVGSPLAIADEGHRTIIAASGNAPPRGSIVICAPFEIAPTGSIAAIGRVQRQQVAATARIRVRVDPFLLLSRPIDMTALFNSVDHSVRESLDEALYRDQFSPKTFTSRESSLMLEALRRVSLEAAEHIDRLLRVELESQEPDMRRLREERDATETAMRLSDVSVSALPPLQQLATSDPSLQVTRPFGLTFDPRYVIDYEDHLIASDLRRFDDSASLTEIAGSMVRIRDKELELTVINVNRTDLEHVFGVDLVYYDHIRDKAVAVQYKRLEWNTSQSAFRKGPEWIYGRRTDLEDQLEKMEPHTIPHAASADDWRLSSSPNFFKFVHQDFSARSSSLLPGMYVPADYLKQGIQEGKFNSGPAGGFQIHEGNTKYLTSTTFVELVRRCWIGTKSTDRSSLAQYVEYRAQQHEVVFASRSRRTV